ncbi:MAG TPA: hypothetical protein VJH23_03560 [archaeon]|nr:hypothetical protein [archaeon]
MFSKGQALIVDFSIALMLFIIMWIFISTEFNSQFSDSLKASEIDSMHLKADYALETLVKTQGSPSNWEALGAADVNSIGLAYADRDISEQKLTSFVNFSGSYDELKEKIGVGETDFYFTFEGNVNASAGLPPGGDADRVIAQRIVTYNGGIAIVTLMLYRLH